jgi:hypothetical protein
MSALFRALAALFTPRQDDYANLLLADLGLER